MKPLAPASIVARLLVPVACLFLLGAGALRAAEPRPLLHPLFSDHAVLQRDKPVIVWGWARPGGRVTATLAGEKARAVASEAGCWQIQFKPLPAGGPHELVVTERRGRTARASDLLVGDVWVCSGQSNMEQGIGVTDQPAAAIAAATNARIRLCWVRKHPAPVPQDLVQLDWQPCSPQSIVSQGAWYGFSGVAYYFGRKLAGELDVPIGLVHTSWGGTTAEAWTSAEGLAPVKDFDGALEALRESQTPGAVERHAERLAAWWQTNDAGAASGWAAPEAGDGDWGRMQLPTNWEREPALSNFNGVVWFRRRVEIPAAWAGKPLTLSLGPIDDIDTTWIGGRLAGETRGWTVPRAYLLPGERVRPGPTVIAVRVLDTSGGGGICGQPQQMSLAPVDAPAQAVSLAGEWRWKRGRAMAEMQRWPRDLEEESGGWQCVPSGLYNGMIHPLTPLAITGFIWYQGESNTGRALQYRRLLPAMIADWRARFGAPEAPFMIVQIANYMPRVADPVEDSGWAVLREAQALTADHVPHCGMACTIDIGDGADIHPRNKKDVGERLALAALQDHYGRTNEFSGPRFVGVSIDGDTVTARFTHAGGLTTTDGKPPVGFALSAGDGAWLAAEAQIDGERVRLRAPGLAKPVAVRYAWANNPAVNLVNGARLPAVPFRTDAPQDEPR